MTKQGKTFKDTKEKKDINSFYKARKDPHPQPKGGHTNLLRDAEGELLEDLVEESQDE